MKRLIPKSITKIVQNVTFHTTLMVLLYMSRSAMENLGHVSIVERNSKAVEGF